MMTPEQVESSGARMASRMATVASLCRPRHPAARSRGVHQVGAVCGGRERHYATPMVPVPEAFESFPREREMSTQQEFPAGSWLTSAARTRSSPITS